MHLFGFLTESEKSLFLLLIGISGVGPKLALNILSGMELGALIAALCEGNTEKLKAINGVGPKLAGRLVLELKEKLQSLHLSGTAGTTDGRGDGMDRIKADALSALVNLGYQKMEVLRALNGIFAEGAPKTITVEQLLKMSLQALSKS